jgi:hypothetical protein
VLPADDDDDALDEAIVEGLATPKNARELPYYDHYTPIHKTPFETREHVAVVRNEPEDEDSESDLEAGMVKIISADPRAAARAAAILKQVRLTLSPPFIESELTALITGRIVRLRVLHETRDEAAQDKREETAALIRRRPLTLFDTSVVARLRSQQVSVSGNSG